MPVVVQDRGPDSACAVLGQGRLALCCARQESVQTVQKLVKFPHAFLDMVIDISVVAQRQFPWAWLFSRPWRFRSCGSLTRISSGAGVEKTVEIPQLQLGEVGLVTF